MASGNKSRDVDEVTSSKRDRNQSKGMKSVVGGRGWTDIQASALRGWNIVSTSSHAFSVVQQTISKVFAKRGGAVPATTVSSSPASSSNLPSSSSSTMLTNMIKSATQDTSTLPNSVSSPASSMTVQPQSRQRQSSSLPEEERGDVDFGVGKDKDTWGVSTTEDTWYISGTRSTQNENGKGKGKGKGSDVLAWKNGARQDVNISSGNHDDRPNNNNKDDNPTKQQQAEATLTTRQTPKVDHNNNNNSARKGSSNNNNRNNHDDGGDDDGVKERIREKQKNSLLISASATQSAASFSKDSKAKANANAKQPTRKRRDRPFGDLNDSTIHEIINEAFRRRSQVGYDKDLATLLPYDLQVELFDEIVRTRKSRQDDSMTSANIVGSINIEAVKDIAQVVNSGETRLVRPSTEFWAISLAKSVGSIPVQAVSNIVHFATSVMVPDAASNAAKQSTKNAAKKQKPRQKFNGLVLDEGMLSLAAALSGSTAGQDLDAMRSASESAAIASLSFPGTSFSTSSTAQEQVSSPNGKPITHVDLTKDQLEKISLAVKLAGSVHNTTSARDFVNTVGVSILVVATRILKHSDMAAAFSALATIANFMPSSRNDILLADGGSILESIEHALNEEKYFTATSATAGWEVEARVSACHLVGSLALAPGTVGAELRAKMASSPRLVRILQRFVYTSSLVRETEGNMTRGARRALAALGVNVWKPRMKGQRGLRILSLDGGGTRAVMAFEILKYLKRITGCEIHEMFDVICGTSTGGIIATSMGVLHKRVEEVETLYRDLIGKIFDKRAINGPKLLITKSYYDTNVFEEILKREAGDAVYIDSRSEEDSNMVFIVSTLMSRTLKDLHLFRNYTYPLGHESRYEGTAEAKLWEGMRASSAAPTFFSEVRINGELHADGATKANNPSAVALHEAKCIFPGVPIEVLVSIGNGNQVLAAMETIVNADEKKSVSWNDILNTIITSATSTEFTHHLLDDVLPSDQYYRFNPTTKYVEIDETSQSRLEEWVRDAQIYIDANQDRFEELAAVLRPQSKKAISQAPWERFMEKVEKLFGNEDETDAEHSDTFLLPRLQDRSGGPGQV